MVVSCLWRLVNLMQCILPWLFLAVYCDSLRFSEVLLSIRIIVIMNIFVFVSVCILVVIISNASQSMWHINRSQCSKTRNSIHTPTGSYNSNNSKHYKNTYKHNIQNCMTVVHIRTVIIVMLMIIVILVILCSYNHHKCECHNSNISNMIHHAYI